LPGVVTVTYKSDAQRL